MLLAVLSDIHANLPALEAVLEDARPHRPDAYVIAGDLHGGPHPSETLDILRSVPGWTIRGNGETYMIRLWQGDAPIEWQTQRQFAFMRWCANQVRSELRSFVAGLPAELTLTPHGLAPVRLVHGSPGQLTGCLYPSEGAHSIERALDQIDEPVLICGHTHEQWQVELGLRLVLNPGAVCGPCDGTVGAEYALLTWREGRWQAKLRQVDYNIAQVRRAFRESGLLDEGGAFARAVIGGIETGVDVARPLLQHAHQYKKARGFGDGPFMPDDIWDAAAASFDWQRYERGAK